MCWSDIMEIDEFIEKKRLIVRNYMFGIYYKSISNEVYEYLFDFLNSGKISENEIIWFLEFIWNRDFSKFEVEDMKSFIDKNLYYITKFGYFDSGYAKSLYGELQAHYVFKKCSIRVEECKDELAKKEAEKEACEETLKCYKKKLGLQNINKMKKHQKKLHGLIMKKQNLDKLVEKMLHNSEAYCYDKVIENICVALEISKYSVKYALKSISITTKINMLVFVLIIVLSINLAPFIFSAVLLQIGIRSFLNNFIFNGKIDKYYDVKWLNEFRNYVLNKYNLKQEKYLSSYQELPECLDKIEECEKEIFSIERDIESVKRNLNELIEYKQKTMNEEAENHLIAEIIFSKEENKIFEKENLANQDGKLKKLYLSRR